MNNAAAPSRAEWIARADSLRPPGANAVLVLADGTVFWGRQTWDWTQTLSPAKAVCSLGLGGLAVVALLTQDYNPFIYFIF